MIVSRILPPVSTVPPTVAVTEAVVDGKGISRSSSYKGEVGDRREGRGNSTGKGTAGTVCGGIVGTVDSTVVSTDNSTGVSTSSTVDKKETFPRTVSLSKDKVSALKVTSSDKGNYCTP